MRCCPCNAVPCDAEICHAILNGRGISGEGHRYPRDDFHAVCRLKYHFSVLWCWAYHGKVGGQSGIRAATSSVATPDSKQREVRILPCGSCL